MNGLEKTHGIAPEHSLNMRTTLKCCLMLCLLAMLNTACHSDERARFRSAAAKTTASALSSLSPVLEDDEKQAIIVDILERFVPHAESFQRASDLTEPQTDWYEATGSGVTQPRGAGNLAFAYVTLLEALPEAESIGGVPREILIDNIIQSIRHEAYTNALSGAGYNRWGNGTWQASLETYPWAFAAFVLWDRLDNETRDLVANVLIAEADILIDKPLASGEEGDSGAEDNAWNAPTPALAAVMFPDHENAEVWRETAIRLALNASSTSLDATDDTTIDGKPLDEWMASVNLHPDLTLENHGFFNPIYQQVTHVNIGDAAIVYGAAGVSLPESFSFRTETIWEEILMRLASDDGDLIMPAGQDWTSKDYQHLCYLSILATRFQRPEASVFESRALETIAARQSVHDTGAILGQEALGYETMLVKRLAAAWWHHRLFGPSPVPDDTAFIEARRAAGGVKAFSYSDFIAARLETAFVSMSWDSARPMGLVVPHGDSDIADPIFTYYAPKSLVGSASGPVGVHTCDCGADHFSTAGAIGDRLFSMTAFRDGATILLDQGEGATFTYALETVPGITGARPIFSAGGEGMGLLDGDWVNAADRLGMIVRGGGGISAKTVSGTNDQIVITGSTGTGTGNRGALILPLTDAATTAALAERVAQPAVPEGWSALVGQAGDGSVRLAAARFGGPSVADLSLFDDRGAPVPEEAAIVDSGRADFRMRLGPTSSKGETIRFFVQSDAAITAHQKSEHTAFIANPTAAPIQVVVTYIPDIGAPLVTEGVLGSGQVLYATPVDGRFILAGPELPLLVEARGVATALLDTLENRGDAAAGRNIGATAALIAATKRAKFKIESATAIAISDDTRVAAAIRRCNRALNHVAWAAARPQIPEEMADAAMASVEQIRSLLTNAADLASGVSIWVTPVGSVIPGESLRIVLVCRNRSRRAARDGVAVVSGPEGWGGTGDVPAFDHLSPGESAAAEIMLQVPATAAPASTQDLTVHLAYRFGRASKERTSTIAVTVDPAVEVLSTHPQIPLAKGGFNQADFNIINFTDRVLDVLLLADAPEGAVATLSTAAVSLEAFETQTVTVTLAGADRIEGRDLLTLFATADTGATSSADTEVTFTRDMALNPYAVPWPHMSASSQQSAHPSVLAQDGDTDTFWVSGGTESGDGPTPESPETLAVDFGRPLEVGAVVMVPRSGYGPTAYTVSVSDDGAVWTDVAEVPSAADDTVTTTFPPMVARFVRLSVTGSWDWVQPPRNVQIRSFIVYPPSGDLAQNPWGAPWPQPLFDSAQPNYPATHAFDADDNTFWVSGGSEAGEGPTPDHPEHLGVEFGEETLIGSITVVPRIGYGPAAYTIERSDDGIHWTQLAELAEAPDDTHTVAFEPTTTRMVRLRMTDSWDWVDPPRNVQIRTLMVEAP
jgi:hypothetical protein